MTARLAELLGLPGPQPDATDKARSVLRGGRSDSPLQRLVAWEPESLQISQASRSRGVSHRLFFSTRKPRRCTPRQARDKAATRRAMRQNGLPTPPVYEIRCDADVEKAAEVVGFPAVLKPVCGSTVEESVKRLKRKIYCKVQLRFPKKARNQMNRASASSNKIPPALRRGELP